MRLTVVNFSRRRIGGTEQNLNVVLPELERRGHLTQFVYFHDAPADRPRINTSPATELVNALALGQVEALRQIRTFAPDAIHVHGEIDPAFQSELLRVAPAAYSVHNYYGACISGKKAYCLPAMQPCHRRFGPACLALYLPRRCGGLSPLTMLSRYRTERNCLAVLSRYDAVITHSSHMQEEYRRHGIHAERLYGLPYEVSGCDSGPKESRCGDIARSTSLLFVGRMEKLKGGQVFLRALEKVQNTLRRPVQAHLAGDGPERNKWEKLARVLARRNPGISVRFHGWVTGAAIDDLYLNTHLLVVPSLWPEPFCKVGPEAATFGVPAAAFSAGGVSEWLTPGVNGMTAPADPPTPEGLAQAITACVSDPCLYQQLRLGALAGRGRFELSNHVDHLLKLFEKLSREHNAFRTEPAFS